MTLCHKEKKLKDRQEQVDSTRPNETYAHLEKCTLTTLSLYFPEETDGFCHTAEQIITPDPFGHFSEDIFVEVQAAHQSCRSQ